MQKRLQRIGAWCGPLMMAVLSIAFIAVAKLIPPPSPSMDAGEILDLYTNDSLRIRLGMGLMILAGWLALPFVVSISSQIARIEGKWAFLSVTQLGAGLFLPFGLTLFPLLLLAVTYRPHARTAETMLMFSDLFWLSFIGAIGPGLVQFATIVTAVFADRSPRPVFPRWFGYFNLWCAVLTLPGTAVFFFHSGPMAWNGLFAFWLVFAVFSFWIVITAYLISTATKQTTQTPNAPAEFASEQ